MTLIPEKPGAIEDQESASAKSEPVPWFQFVMRAQEADISKRFSDEARQILDDAKNGLAGFAFLFLLDADGSIGNYEADRVFRALSGANSERDKDVLLFLLSSGGSVESAYQISKLCKSYARERFVVAIPRRAKSAATLIAIGADSIHMGPLGELGPIDPQLGGLPALGVLQALTTIASLSEKFPGSSEMFARYLRMALTVEQIGFCERISESAVQYAERLLGTKKALTEQVGAIAKRLVYEYKHHGFVIDAEEAKKTLGDDWIVTESAIVDLAERVYRKYEEVNFLLRVLKQRRLIVAGNIESGVLMIPLPKA